MAGAVSMRSREKTGLRRYIVSPLKLQECIDVDGGKQEDSEVAVRLDLVEVLGG